MTLDDIEYLVAVAENRNIGRAADALGLTQPALTRAVARMETMAGQRLFTRHPKGVELTAAGTALLRHARRMRLEYQDAMQELQLLKNGQLGVLRVGYSPAADEDHLVGALRRLLVERPAAQLRVGQVMAPYLLEEVSEGKLDIGIGPVPVPLPPHLERRTLYPQRQNLVADRSHPLFRRESLSLMDLAQEEWALPVGHTRLRDELEAALSGAGLPPLRVRLEVFTANAGTYKLLLGTRLLSMCSDWWLPQLQRLGLEKLPFEGAVALRDVAAVRRAGAPRAPLADRLIELLQRPAA